MALKTVVKNVSNPADARVFQGAQTRKLPVRVRSTLNVYAMAAFALLAAFLATMPLADSQAAKWVSLDALALPNYLVGMKRESLFLRLSS